MKEVDPYDKSEGNPLRKACLFAIARPDPQFRLNNCFIWMQQVNPRVLVPALRHGDRNIYESMVCVEYLDEEFGGGKATPRRLMPVDTYERAMTRIAVDTLGKTIVSAFYKTLQTQSDDPEYVCVCALS